MNGPKVFGDNFGKFIHSHLKPNTYQETWKDLDKIM